MPLVGRGMGAPIAWATMVEVARATRRTMLVTLMGGRCEKCIWEYLGLAYRRWGIGWLGL